MTITVGIGLAFVAMLCWGFGDFLIQKSTRKLGDWETLFLICGFGSIILLPFVWKDILFAILNDKDNFLILLIGALILFIAALIDFEALKKGKLAIVEPIWSLEVPVAAFLAFFILNERISFFQIILIAFLIICLFLVSFREKTFNKKFFMERGVIWAFIGAFFMGGANFFYGWGARISDPLVINFVVNVFVTFATSIYLLSMGKFKIIIKDFMNNKLFVLPMIISDNVAWIAFAFSMTLAPIAVATALSESYIIIAVLLGLFINREKIQFHQKVGLIGAIITAIILAVITTA